MTARHTTNGLQLHAWAAEPQTELVSNLVTTFIFAREEVQRN